MINNERGYTLVEVLVALVLLFLILTPSTYVVSKLVSGSNLEERHAATKLATDLMEKSLIEHSFARFDGEMNVNGRRYKLQRRTSRVSSATALVTIRIFRRSAVLIALHRTIEVSQESL